MKIAVIPIDNRPICYDFIVDTLKINNDIELFMPDIADLGGLTTSASIDNLFKFLNDLDKVDYLILSLDTIAYGGLVTSRRTNDSFDTIKSRIEKLVSIASSKAKKVLAFSSVMRISNNNINEEEKEYWAQWGKRIFDWSYYLHKCEVNQSYNCVCNKVPDDILQDYLKTRKRNFEINRLYLSLAKQGFFDTLIYSKDDCAQYGLNVKEANLLKEESKDLKNVQIKTGADEIPLSLISKAMCDYYGKVKIKPVFVENNSKELISKYEDIALISCVKNQIEIADCLICDDADLNMIVNNFQYEQGDLVLGDVVNKTDKQIDFTKNYFIADVNNANGADANLINQLFKKGYSSDFYGIACYNTSANTIGASLFVALTKYLCKNYNENAFKKVQLIRLLDDWAYQSISRKYVKESEPEFNYALKQKEDELNCNLEKIKAFLNYEAKAIYTLPWNRSFEIRITLQDKCL